MALPTILNNAVINAGNTPAILAGALADRPSAGYEGLVYVANDAGNENIYQYISGAWVQITVSGGGGVGNLQQVTTLGDTTTIGVRAIESNIEAITSLIAGCYVGVRNPGTGQYLRHYLRLGLFPTIEFLNNVGVSTQITQSATVNRAQIFPDGDGFLTLSVNGILADGAGNVTLPTLPASSVYTPSFSNLTAGINSVSVSETWNFIQLGDIVHVFGILDIDLGAGAGAGESFDLDLPVASDFTSGTRSSLSGTSQPISSSFALGGYIQANTSAASGAGTITFDGIPNNIFPMSVHFSYKVI